MRLGAHRRKAAPDRFALTDLQCRTRTLAVQATRRAKPHGSSLTLAQMSNAYGGGGDQTVDETVLRTLGAPWGSRGSRADALWALGRLVGGPSSL